MSKNKIDTISRDFSSFVFFWRCVITLKGVRGTKRTFGSEEVLS